MNETITLTCPKCGGDIEVTALCEIEAKPIASIGLSVIFDPPGFVPPNNWLPDEIRCKLCKTVYGV